MTFEGCIHLDRVRELAEDSRPTRAPYVGIPIISDEGERKCIIIPRKILQAAVMFAESVRWDEAQQRLIVNGNKRSCYSLISQDAYHVRGKLEEWARSQRKRVVSKSATPCQRKAAKIDQDVAKFQRQLDKIWNKRPVNPICQAPRQHAGDYLRDSEAAWHEGKPVRVELSRRFTSPALKAIRHIGIRSAGPKWKELYAEAAKILGIEAIPDVHKHSRVTKLTRGPSLHDYILSPETHLARQHKPWRHDTSFDVEALRRSRLEYLESLSQRRAIQAQIENLLKVKQEILGGS
jgi:hypothetical protein